MALRGAAFDAFGTLFDLEGLRPGLAEELGDAGDDVFDGLVARLVPWSWHATAAGRYRPFPEIAALAVRSAALEAGVALPHDRAARLAEGLGALPAFPDADAALASLAERGLRLAVLSNGTKEGVRSLVEGAGLAGHFDHLLAADSVGRFKPAPEVYDMAPEALGLMPEEVILVSGNDWDVAGAQQRGLAGLWVSRGRPVTEAFGARPTLVARELADLPAALASGEADSGEARPPD